MNFEKHKFLPMLLIMLFALVACEQNNDPVEEGSDFTFSLVNGSDTVSFVMKFINKKSSKGIKKNYMIAETETTRELYYAVYGKKVKHKKRANLPVSNVSCLQAENFISELNKKVEAPYGMKFCLPTVDEWLYAADGGQRGFSLPFAGCSSRDQYSFYAWYDGNSDGHKHDVKTLRPNQLKLYDMNGNVWEWCYAGNPNAAPGTRRQLCGSAYNEKQIWRSDYLGNKPVDSYKSSAVGFRLCLKQID